MPCSCWARRWRLIPDGWSSARLAMSLSFFIARRIYREGAGGKRVSRPAVLIAMAGIAVGLAVMIIAVSIIVGFKREVRNTVAGFGAHLRISGMEAVNAYENSPVVADDSLRTLVSRYAEVKHVQRYSMKPGMVKTDDAFQGIMLKGVGQEYDLSFLKAHLLEGEMPQFSDSASSGRVLVSRSLADKLKLRPGDKIDTYYIEEEIRARRLQVAGIYQTNFAEYDNLFILSDLYLVNRLNRWKPGQASGLEVELRDYGRLEDATWELASLLDGYTDVYGAAYGVRNVEQLNPQLFAWLGILDVNIWVILVLMVGVAGFTMISGLLIIIIERTSMIGILKALGAGDALIRRIFLWFSVFLIGRGMLWGNVFGLGFFFLQRFTGLFGLDPETYYMDTVPVSLNLWIFFALNAGTLLISVCMLLGPSYLIARIRPAGALRYE